ncbi:hypothetical protein O3M35_009519 [Rhynocoris fuscipes]|uniref:Mitochondrial transcription rescue factor 1 C-terminal domain-containing protein n=1 Tax=Rhynocoris fuscipes TaxID=488301 RepID=A0AAW1D6S0_9HEMI
MQAVRKIIQSRIIFTRMYSSNQKIFLMNKFPRRTLIWNINNDLENFVSPFLIINRHKFKKPSKTRIKDEEYESDSDSDEEITNNDPNSKLITGRMQSLRVDSVLKAGLGLARNKVETLFYDDRILINGRNITKKSVKVDVDDEIDVITGNKDDHMLSVSRVIVKSAIPNDNDDGIIVKMKRYKNLIIENNNL